MSTWLKRLIVLLFWLVVWQLVSLAVANPILLSDPITVAETLVAGVQTPSFWSTILFSALRIFVGFSCAFALSLALGALAHRYPIFAMLFDPAVQFIKSVPIVCIIVLLLIWFGSSTVSAVAVFLVAFPSFYFALVEGLKASDLRMREMLKVFRVSRLRRIFALHWPTVLPYLIAASKVTVGMSWKSGVAAELIGLPPGSLGERIYQAKITLSSADLFAHTLLIVLISLICERIFLLLLKKSGDWSWRAALSFALSSARPRAFSATCNLPSLVLSGVTKHYASKVILKEYSLTLRQGQRLALSGPSGSGKTTVLSLLAGLVKPDAGHAELRATTSMVFQESRLFEDRSALDNLALVLGHETGQELEGETRHETGQARIAAILGEILPLDSLDKPVSQLSGGMRRRVELARALAAASDVVLLDEPFTGLDDENRRRAQAFVNKHLAGRALVIAGHDPSDFDSLHTTETEYTLGETGR